MTNVLNVSFVVSVAMALTACGGDSDSSGGSSDSEYRPQAQSTCRMINNTIYVNRDSKPCKVPFSSLNNGRVFSLKCYETTDEDLGTFDDFYVTTYEFGSNINSVVDDIAQHVVNRMLGTNEYTRHKYQCF